jgi:tartrate-resistant acid phosphatase type 5
MCRPSSAIVRHRVLRVLALAATLAGLAACTVQAPPPRPSLQATAAPGTAAATAQALPSPAASVEAPAFTFAVKGDWGAGTPEQAEVTKQMCAQQSKTPFDVLVTTGDNFYGPDGVATDSNYYSPESCLRSETGLTIHATWGNHDVPGDSTSKVLGAPQRYYRWSAPGVDFFVLDSNRPSDPAQTAWLAGQLEASKAAWKIAVFHHPPFTVGLHESNLEVRDNWVPLLERFHVALVLNGHNHDYEHELVNGVDYVVSGGGGAPVYPCADTPAWLVRCLSVNHFLIIGISRAQIRVQAIDGAGTQIDEFVIAARPA